MSPSAVKCIDNFPRPLLLRLHLDNGVVARKRGCPLSPNCSNLFRRYDPKFHVGSSIEDHLFSEAGPVNDHCPTPNFYATTETTFAFVTDSFSLSFAPQEMSLSIDMKEFFQWKFLVFLPSCSVELCLYCRAATLWILGRCSTRIQSALHWFRQSLCSFEKMWSIQSFSSKLRWIPDVDGSSHDSKQNWEDIDFCALKIDNCFITNPRQIFQWMLVPTNRFQTWDPHLVLPNFADMSNICFNVRSAVFTMEFSSFWKFWHMNTADSIVTAINILQTEKCSSPSPATFEILFCLFRTWSFTRITNDLDSTDNSDSVVSPPMMKFWGLANSLETHSLPWNITKCFSVPYGLRSVVEKNSSGRTFLTILQEVWSRRPDRSYKHGRHPILNNLLKRSFPWIAHGSNDQRIYMNLCHCEVSLIYLLLQLISMDLNCLNICSPNSARRFITSLDFAVTHSSPKSCWDHFTIVSEQTVELKWPIWTNNKWFHSQRVKFPPVKQSTSSFLVSMYLIWIILEFRLFRSNNQSSATLWVLETTSHCRTPSFNDHLDHCFIVLKHIQ